MDTHVVLWFLGDAAKLSEAALNVILDPASEKYVSIVSAWEAAVKISLGKLRFDGGAADFFRVVEENGFTILPVKRKHVELVETLPFHRRDPFDRMLVAAAASESMNFVTSDANIRLYGVDCVW
ncbi:MAG: type II toxin-antitoxin system VapC family toxin [Desulfovibrio sp.]|nr:type II toxin-antitoxin system VapC family toxin [Desulfovibrio sp.]